MARACSGVARARYSCSAAARNGLPPGRGLRAGCVQPLICHTVLMLNCCHPFPLVRGTERRIFGVARCLPQAAQGAGSALADVRFSSCAGWQAGRCIGIAVQLLASFLTLGAALMVQRTNVYAVQITVGTECVAHYGFSLSFHACAGLLGLTHSQSFPFLTVFKSSKTKLTSALRLMRVYPGSPT